MTESVPGLLLWPRLRRGAPCFSRLLSACLRRPFPQRECERDPRVGEICTWRTKLCDRSEDVRKEQMPHAAATLPQHSELAQPHLCCDSHQMLMQILVVRSLDSQLLESAPSPPSVPPPMSPSQRGRSHCHLCLRSRYHHHQLLAHAMHIYCWGFQPARVRVPITIVCGMLEYFSR